MSYPHQTDRIRGDAYVEWREGGIDGNWAMRDPQPPQGSGGMIALAFVVIIGLILLASILIGDGEGTGDPVPPSTPVEAPAGVPLGS